jgi:hypothetical protein
MKIHSIEEETTRPWQRLTNKPIRGFLLQILVTHQRNNNYLRTDEAH